MNKFQKLAYKMAKNDVKKEIYKNITLKKMIRINYAIFKNKKRFNYEKAKAWVERTKETEW